MLTSCSTSFRSWGRGVQMNLAANSVPVDVSTQRFTSPNFPLWREHNNSHAERNRLTDSRSIYESKHINTIITATTTTLTTAVLPPPLLLTPPPPLSAPIRFSCHIEILYKSFTHSCLWRFGVKIRHSIPVLR